MSYCTVTQKEHKVNPNIFRLYDIRGKYPLELDDDVAYKIGTYFGALSKGQQILVGRDARLSSESLFHSLTRGIIDAGGKVSSAGLVTTPIIYYIDQMERPYASIMITASHSPKDCNGFKMLLKSKPFFGEKLDELLQYIKSAPEYSVAQNYNIEDKSFSISEYIARILENISVNPEFKIAWDTGNGVAGDILPLLLQKLPNQNIHINSEVDGNFPNRSPDQMEPGGMDALVKAVIDNKCDLGISFDGDGDRTIFVSSSGKVIPNDHILCLFAEDILQNNPGALMIADVKTSQTFFDYVERLGGQAIMSKTGHAFIKDLIKKTGALFAGELSSHIFFADKYYGFDDGIYAGLRMLDLLTRKSVSIDELCSRLPKSFATKEIKVAVKDEDKFNIVDEIKDKMTKMGREFIDIDGVRYKNEYGWWLIRASNTESSLMARAESMTEEGLQKVRADLDAFLPSSI